QPRARVARSGPAAPKTRPRAGPAELMTQRDTVSTLSDATRLCARLRATTNGPGRREMLMGRPDGGDRRLPAVFPDCSPYSDLEAAARAYLRDPDLALEELNEVLSAGSVLAFTLERFVNETNGVWQEVAVCDGSRLVLWHGEAVTGDDGPGGAMTSSIRVVPLSQVAEVGSRRRILRGPGGNPFVD